MINLLWFLLDIVMYLFDSGYRMEGGTLIIYGFRAFFKMNVSDHSRCQWMLLVVVPFWF